MKKIAIKGPKTPVAAPTKPTPAATKIAVTKKSVAAKKTAQAPTPVAKVAKPKAVAASVPPACPVAPEVCTAPGAAAPTVVPAIKPPAPESVAPTTIVAQIDVGFGNALYLRGEGAGLNWDQGVPMENVAADRWQLVFTGATTPVVFKFLMNDLTWCAGEDYVVTPGSTLALTPLF